jgi:hypothetical protein
MGDLGLFGLLAPAAEGGSGTPFRQFVLALEEIAAADAGLSTLLHVHAFTTAMIARNATTAQKAAWLPGLLSGEVIAATALTEPGAGSDLAAISTQARRVPKGWRLSGAKQFITNGARAGLVVVLAVTDPQAGRRGKSAFLVPKTAPGVSVGRLERKLGQHTSDTAELLFDDVFVPEEALFGEVGGGFPLIMRLLSDGRISIAAQAVGIARAAFERARAYACERKAFGRTLGEHQAVAFRLADMATEVEIARTFVLSAADMIDAGSDCVRQASMAKLFAAEMAERVCSAALQTLGGYGYVEDYDVARYYRDARVCQIYEGTSDIQRLIIARQLFN